MTTCLRLAAALAGVTAIAAAATALAAAPAAPAPAAGDARHGAQLFLQCRVCHVVAPGAAATIGPNLAGVVGSKAAARPGYAYSPALTKAGLVWTPTTLDTFLKRPAAAVPGTKMAFPGVSDATARADIIAYLATLKAR